MTEPLKEQSRMIAKELSWKPTEREELIEIIRKGESSWLDKYRDTPKEISPNYFCFLADAILEWHKKEVIGELERFFPDEYDSIRRIVHIDKIEKRIAELKTNLTAKQEER